MHNFANYPDEVSFLLIEVESSVKVVGSNPARAKAFSPLHHVLLCNWQMYAASNLIICYETLLKSDHFNFLLSGTSLIRPLVEVQPIEIVVFT